VDHVANQPAPRTGRFPQRRDQAARRVTVLSRMRQLTAALSFAAVILMSAGTVSGTKDGPTTDKNCGPPSAVLVMVARIPPSTTSGVVERRTLNVAVHSPSVDLLPGYATIADGEKAIAVLLDADDDDAIT
jgi:hypothetical protein